MNLVHIFVQERKKNIKEYSLGQCQKDTKVFAETLWLKVEKLSIKKNNDYG